MKSSLLKFYSFVIFLSGMSLFVSLIIFNENTFSELILFSITILAFTISLFALHISVRTYISIDSVNAMTKMDGNILENENYRSDVVALIEKFDYPDSAATGCALFDYLKSLFSAKKEYSGIEFANNLQKTVDVIVLLPFVFNSADKDQLKNVKKTDELLKLIKTKFNKMNQLSNGTLILLEETIKLIESVTQYQKLSNLNQNLTSSLMNVRGDMLKNSLSKTIYYNYRGLYFSNKALQLLKGKSGISGDIYSIESLKHIKLNIKQLSNDSLEIILIYLKDGAKYYDQALSNIHDDIMWYAFIKYNIARNLFFYALIIGDYTDKRWLQEMNEAILYRRKLNLLLSDLLENKVDNHLQKAFYHQELLARLVKVNFEFALDLNITDCQGKTEIRSTELKKMKDYPLVKELYEGPFNRVKIYQEDILAHI